MATTLDDARIVLKIDTTQAEQAAEEFLRKRRGGGARGGSGGGGGAPPGGGSGPSPADQPDPQDGGPGTGARALNSLAAGSVAGIPGVRFIGGVAVSVAEAEGIQAVSGFFSGFMNNPTDAELRKEWNRARGFKQHLDATLHAFEAGMHDMFRWFEDGITTLENKARYVLAAISAASEGLERMEAQAVLGVPPDFKGAVELVGIRAEMAEAQSQLREARQRVAREMMGAAMRDKADDLRDKMFDKLLQQFRAW